MTPARLIDDLRARYPVFTVVWEGDLIRVEMPEPFRSPAWIRPPNDAGECVVSPSRRCLRDEDALVAHYDHLPGALLRTAAGWRAYRTPDLAELAPLKHGPFDAEVRVLAKRRAGVEAERADRMRKAADTALAVAQEAHAKAHADADLWASSAADFMALAVTP